MIARIERTLRYLEAVGQTIAGASMVAVLAIVFTDVLLRYVFSAPLSWAYDVISRYLLIAVFYFVVSDTLRADRHIRVLFFRPFIPARLRAAVDACTYLVSALIIGVIAWMAIRRGYGEFLRGDKFVGAYLWPTWITSAAVGVGMTVLALRLVLMGLRRAMDVPAGRLDAVVDNEGGEAAR
jgi:TRAP-type C4-dicarboxylate transport system permease small subunit